MHVLLAVQYGSDSGAEVELFINEMIKRGWQQFTESPATFTKTYHSHTVKEIEQLASKDLNDAAFLADFTDTPYALLVSEAVPVSGQ